MITETDCCPLNGDSPTPPTPVRTIEYTVTQPMFSLPASITDDQLNHFIRVSNLHSWQRRPWGEVVIYGQVSGQIDLVTEHA